MPKYENPFPETQELYTKAIINANLAQFINISVLSDNLSKEIFVVHKANALLKFRTNDDIVIVVNEKIFDQLTPEQRVIVVEESIASISYDSEKDKIVISKPDVVTFSGILDKYTFETWNTLKESVKTLYAAEKQAEDELKAVTEKAKKKKY